MESTPPSNKPPETPAQSSKERLYGGRTRFEIEAEFVSMLGNPDYLQALSTQSQWTDVRFVNYLNYLQYWSQPAYRKYLIYPGPTLAALKLLQSEKFRQEITRPDVVAGLKEEWIKASFEWHSKKPGEPFNPSSGANTVS